MVSIGIPFLLLGTFGCSTTTEFQPSDVGVQLEQPNSVVLREGDVLRVNFPSNPNLNASVQIRPDGRITLSLIGEVMAAGKTPEALQDELKKLYSSQLVTSQITVSVESSTFGVFVTGAVLRPGKIETRRPITALEAIMEAGGPDYNHANLKAVKIIRNKDGRTTHFILNLKRVLDGQDSEAFYLKPSDIVYVPEKFSWL